MAEIYFSFLAAGAIMTGCEISDVFNEDITGDSAGPTGLLFAVFWAIRGSSFSPHWSSCFVKKSEFHSFRKQHGRHLPSGDESGDKNPGLFLK